MTAEPQVLEVLTPGLLDGFTVLDSRPDEDLDDVVGFAADLCGVPAALATLTDGSGVWFRSRVALDATDVARVQAELGAAVVSAGGLVEVADPAGPSAIRFFAGVPLRSAAGVPLGMLCVIDLEPRRLDGLQRAGLETLARQVVAQLELRDSADAARLAARSMAETQRVAGVGSWEWDIANDVITWSAELYRLFGLDPSRFEGTYEEYVAAVHPDDRDIIEREVGQALATGGDFSFDHRVVWPDGTVRWLHCRGSVETGSGGTPIRMRGTAADITERIEVEAELSALALVDELTGLRNRRGLVVLADQQAKVAARAGLALSAVFVDIDGMKAINDSYGHAEGDRALVAVAGALRATFRASDIVARLGGDEFCVLLVDDQGQVDGELDRRIASLRSVAPSATRGYEISLSVGLARLKPGESGSVENLLSRADRAMYLDKGSSRRRPRVLVIEDDPGLRRLAELSLRSRYDVRTAATGGQGLDQVAEQLPDLILLDLCLPDIPGSEVLRRLREQPGGGRVPVIVVTASGERDSQLVSLRGGVDDYVVKPVDLEILEARMDSVLRRAAGRTHRRSA